MLYLAVWGQRGWLRQRPSPPELHAVGLGRQVGSNGPGDETVVAVKAVVVVACIGNAMIGRMGVKEWRLVVTESMR